MATRVPPGQTFSSKIAALIAEIEACLGTSEPSADREARLQREAFLDRSQQARNFARRLASASEQEWSRRSGDAHRIHQALRHSLDYFRHHGRD
jgi:hypothetical protein